MIFSLAVNLCHYQTPDKHHNMLSKINSKWHHRRQACLSHD